MRWTLKSEFIATRGTTATAYSYRSKSWLRSIMNWYLYLPPMFAIYLLVTSAFSKRFISKRIETFMNRPHDVAYINKQSEIAGLAPSTSTSVNKLINSFWISKTPLIQNIALDWSARLNFFNSMFTAVFSVVSIYSKTKNFDYTVIAIVILVAILAPIMWWIFSMDVDELVSRKIPRLKVTPATLCRIILILVNVGLIIAIYYSQQAP
jgi:hypothetical protein